MHIFRLPASLPAYLNAFHGNVLDISSRFQFLPFSTLIRFRRAVPPCSPLPVSPCLDSSRSPSRFIPLVWRLALVPLGSPFLSPSHLFPSRLALTRPASIFAPPAVSWGGEVGRSWSLRSAASVALADINSVPSACQARPVHRVVVRGGRREGALPMPSARLCGFRVAKQSVYIPSGNRLIYRYRKRRTVWRLGL